LIGLGGHCAGADQGNRRPIARVVRSPGASKDIIEVLACTFAMFAFFNNRLRQ